jgi:hypothetical protein
MKRNKPGLFTRRWLLGGAGAAGLGLPFVGSLARAGAGDTSAKRLIVFCTPNEPIGRSYWKPPGEGNSFALTGMTPMMASLEPHMDKLLVVGDLELTSRFDDPHQGGHIGMGHLLVGRRVTELSPDEPDHWASGISVDQYIADARGVEALTLGVRVSGNDGNSRISYRGDSQPVDPQTRPDDVFDSLFADALLPAEELAALKARRLSVLDRVAGDLARVAPTLPTEARHKLDIHADMVRELELQIESDAVVDCDPTAPGEMNYDDNANFPTAVRRQIDVMVQALGCGVSDVATLQLANSGASNITPLWPNEGIDINVDYHNIAHDFNQSPGGTITNRRVEMETFMFSLFAYLLQKLDEVPEGTGGTMLDNSVVLWMKPIGHNHRQDELLFMLAGSGAGQLQTGRFISFPEQPHNNLLVNLCNLMGLPDTSFGDPDYCTGALEL